MSHSQVNKTRMAFLKYYYRELLKDRGTITHHIWHGHVIVGCVILLPYEWVFYPIRENGMLVIFTSKAIEERALYNNLLVSTLAPGVNGYNYSPVESLDKRSVFFNRGTTIE